MNELEARWGIFKENGKFQVAKLKENGSQGEPIGKPHDSRKEARDHQAALYSNSPDMKGTQYDAPNYRLAEVPDARSCANCLHLEGLKCKLYDFIVEQTYTCDSQETSMDYNTLEASIKFEADEQNPRFLRFKDAILARAEVNKNMDRVDLAGIQQIADTIPFTHIDIEHDGKKNVGMFTAGRVGANGELLVDGVVWLDACEALGVNAQDIVSGKFGLSVEAEALTATCTKCGGVWDKATDYCAHIKSVATRFAHKAERFMQGMKGVGGALTYRPAASGSGFGSSTIFMMASHLEDEVTTDELSPKADSTMSATQPFVITPELQAHIESLVEAAISKREDVTPADKKRAEEEYGDVEYADEKNKKYPLDSLSHVHSAESYFGMPKNREKYSPEEQKAIQAKIDKALKKFGGSPSDKNKQESAMSDEVKKDKADSPEEEKKETPAEKEAEKNAEKAAMEAEMKSKMDKMESDYQASLKEKDEELVSVKAKLDEALNTIKASKTADLKSKLLTANVMTAEEFDAQAETLLATDPKVLELVLKGKPQIKNDPLKMAGETEPVNSSNELRWS